MPIFALLIPLLIFGTVTSLVLAFTYKTDSKQDRAARRLASVASLKGPEGDGELVALRDKIGVNGLIRVAIEQLNLGPRLEDELVGSGLSITLGQYLTYRVMGAAGGFIVGYILTQMLLAALFIAGIAFMIPRFYVSNVKNKRMNLIESQLAEAFSLVATALKSGYSFIQALESATKELPPPLSEELFTALRDMNLGTPVEVALEALNQRIRSYDVDLALTAVVIQRQVGGNLAEILENVSETIRERFRLRGEVKTLTAQSRLSSYILGGLPFIIGALMSMLNPNYLPNFVAEPMGRMLIGGALVSEAIGFFVIQKISKVEV